MFDTTSNRKPDMLERITNQFSNPWVLAGLGATVVALTVLALTS